MKPTFFLRSVLATALLFAAPAFATEKPDAALSRWVKAVQTANVDNIMKFYDDNAIMVSTFADAPMVGRSAIVDYYKLVVVNPDIKVEVTDSHSRTFGNVAVITGLYTLSYTEEGEPVVIHSRFSFVYVLEGGKWLIVDHHASRVPSEATGKTLVDRLW